MLFQSNSLKLIPREFWIRFFVLVDYGFLMLHKESSLDFVDWNPGLQLADNKPSIVLKRRRIGKRVVAEQPLDFCFWSVVVVEHLESCFPVKNVQRQEFSDSIFSRTFIRFEIAKKVNEIIDVVENFYSQAKKV